MKNYTNVVKMVVLMVIAAVLTGCMGPSSKVVIWKTPKGHEVGVWELGNAGVSVTQGQNDNMNQTIREQNQQKHDESTQKIVAFTDRNLNSSNQKQAKVEVKSKTDIVMAAIENSGGTDDVVTIMGADYNARRKAIVDEQYRKWKAAHPD